MRKIRGISLILAGLLFLQAMLPTEVFAANPERDYSIYRAEPVLVSSTAELIAALEDNTTLVLAPGTYNITEYIETLRHPAVWDYFLEQEQGVYIADEFDGPELVICGYHNISMISADSKKPA
ncbi:MAG: hypothetical protein K6G83_01145, partial [Lachnospiraceae bacterium]|nr:hypothetical protein [Lachnospiraceae bacterium]